MPRARTTTKPKRSTTDRIKEAEKTAQEASAAAKRAEGYTAASLLLGAANCEAKIPIPKTDRVTFADSPLLKGDSGGCASIPSIPVHDRPSDPHCVHCEALSHDLEKVQTENDELQRRLDTKQNRLNFGDYFCYAVFSVIVFAILGIGAAGWAHAISIARSLVSFANFVPSW